LIGFNTFLSIFKYLKKQSKVNKMENSPLPSPVQHGAFKISFSGGRSSVGGSSSVGGGSSVGGSSVGDTRHLFIDNSNIYIGAMKAFPDQTVGTNVSALVMLLGSGGLVVTKFVAGSQNSDKRHHVWDEYERLGFTVSLHGRLKNSKTGTNHETGVDSAIHAAALMLVVKKGNLPPGTHTIVLVTGDGNSHNDHSSFPDTVDAAAKAGFRVEIWSWKASCATRIYTDIAKNYGHGVVTINYLDSHKDKICFIKKDESTTLGGSALAGGSSTGPVSSDSVGTLSTMDAPVCVAGGFTISFRRKPG
jgi:hypothetical protein